MAKRNPHSGSGIDDLLKEDGIFNQVQAKALKRAIAEQLEESMAGASLTKVKVSANDGDQSLAPRPDS